MIAGITELEIAKDQLVRELGNEQAAKDERPTLAEVKVGHVVVPTGRAAGDARVVVHGDRARQSLPDARFHLQCRATAEDATSQRTGYRV